MTKRTRIKNALLIVCAIMFNFFSTTKGLAMELSGNLIISANQGIETLDLQNFERRVVLNNKFPRYLTKIDNQHVLMESQGGINELDINTGKLRRIRANGNTPKFIQEHQKLFFKSQKIIGEGKSILFIANMADPENAEEIEEPHKRKYGFSSYQVIQISRDEVIFGYDERIWTYNIVKKVVKELSITCPLPQVFRAATGKLLCRNYDKRNGPKGTTFLVDLNDGSEEEIPGLLGHAPVLYIEKFDALITSKSRLNIWPLSKMGETHDLWIYSFKDGSSTLLKKNITIGLGSAVWVEK